jgi:hypothetical protein
MTRTYIHSFKVAHDYAYVCDNEFWDISEGSWGKAASLHLLPESNEEVHDKDSISTNNMIQECYMCW